MNTSLTEVLVSISRNYKTSEISYDIELSHVLHQIKYGGNNTPLIERLRLYEKGSEQYDLIKGTLNVFTPNGTFLEKRCANNLYQLSGFIYVDFDNEYIKIDQLIKYSFFHSVWKSAGGKGFGSLIYTQNLTTENFTNTYFYLQNFFAKDGLKLDAQCKDVSRVNVISYDPDLYENPNLIPLDVSTIPEQIIFEIPKKNEKVVSSECFDILEIDMYKKGESIEKRKEKTMHKLCYNFSDRFIQRFNYETTLEDEVIGENLFIYIPEGKPYIRCTLSEKVRIGNRHQELCAYMIAFLYNNPYIEYEYFFTHLQWINSKRCEPELSYEELRNSCRNLYIKHRFGVLEYPTKLKRFWFNRMLKGTGFNYNKITGEYRTDAKLKLIKELYDKLSKNNKITTAYQFNKLIDELVSSGELSDRKGISKRTINSYWKEYGGISGTTFEGRSSTNNDLNKE